MTEIDDPCLTKASGMNIIETWEQFALTSDARGTWELLFSLKWAGSMSEFSMKN